MSLSETDSTQDYVISGSGKKHIIFVHYFGGDAGSWQWLTKTFEKYPYLYMS